MGEKRTKRLSSGKSEEDKTRTAQRKSKSKKENRGVENRAIEKRASENPKALSNGKVSGRCFAKDTEDSQKITG